MDHTIVQFANITAMSQPNNELVLVKVQSKEISHHIVYYLLNEDGITLNGHRTGNGHSITMRNLIAKHNGFQDAISTLETCCKSLKARHQKEIEARVDTLEISDCQLYREYQDSCRALMDDDIRWGRITVLLFFTSVLAKRLYKEGKTSKIESLVGWQTSFLDDEISQWILEHGGWVSGVCVCVCDVGGGRLYGLYFILGIFVAFLCTNMCTCWLY